MKNTQNPPATPADKSPPALTQAGTPAWMQFINDYEGLDIHSCKIIGYAENTPLIMPCASHEASLWVVFGRYSMRNCVGGFDALEKFSNETEALAFHDRLLAAYPHLSGEQPQPQRPQGNVDSLVPRSTI